MRIGDKGSLKNGFAFFSYMSSCIMLRFMPDLVFDARFWCSKNEQKISFNASTSFIPPSCFLSDATFLRRNDLNDLPSDLITYASSSSLGTELVDVPCLKDWLC